MNILRRTFLKAIAFTPLAFLLPKGEKRQVNVANTTDSEDQWANIETKVIRIFWDGRWWSSLDNRIFWTERRGVWLEIPGRAEFTEYHVLPTLDWCADMCVFKDSLIWTGKKGDVWRIERTEREVLPYQFRLIQWLPFLV